MKVRIGRLEFDTLAAWSDAVVMHAIELLEQDANMFGDYGNDLITTLIALSAEFNFVEEQVEFQSLHGHECVWLWFTCETQEVEMARLVHHMFYRVVPVEYRDYIKEFCTNYVTFAKLGIEGAACIGA